MPEAERPICSSISLAVGEPLVATASRFRFWLMVEQPGPWGHDAMVSSGLPVGVGRALRDLGRRLGIRVLLIKQRSREAGGRRCFAAYTGSHERWVRSFDVAEADELLDLDLPGSMGDRFRGIGEPVDGPLFLVCTHGKHDPCCARHGAPLYRALAGFGRGAAWECTHIGGDRFAGNLVCFPHGLYFGRVRPAEAETVAGSYAEGRIVLDRYRGRSAFSPPVQAAEDVVRRRFGILGVDDLELTGHRRIGPRRHRVEFGAGDRRHVVEVEVSDLEPRQLTCKADEPAPTRGFAATELEDRANGVSGGEG
ncbi:MAG: sucrase ferredoxin [Actinomycetota bacterium]